MWFSFAIIIAIAIAIICYINRSSKTRFDIEKQEGRGGYEYPSTEIVETTSASYEEGKTDFVALPESFTVIESDGTFTEINSLFSHKIVILTNESSIASEISENLSLISDGETHFFILPFSPSVKLSSGKYICSYYDDNSSLSFSDFNQDLIAVYVYSYSNKEEISFSANSAADVMEKLISYIDYFTVEEAVF